MGKGGVGAVIGQQGRPCPVGGGPVGTADDCKGIQVARLFPSQLSDAKHKFLDQQPDQTVVYPDLW